MVITIDPLWLRTERTALASPDDPRMARLLVLRRRPRSSRPIVLKVNAEVKRIVELPDLRDRLSAEGAEVTASTPEQFAAYLKTEMVKWARVVQASGARTE